MKELPKLGTGKPDYVKLRELIAENTVRSKE